MSCWSKQIICSVTCVPALILHNQIWKLRCNGHLQRNDLFQIRGSHIKLLNMGLQKHLSMPLHCHYWYVLLILLAGDCHRSCGTNSTDCWVNASPSNDGNLWHPNANPPWGGTSADMVFKRIGQSLQTAWCQFQAQFEWKTCSTYRSSWYKQGWYLITTVHIITT